MSHPDDVIASRVLQLLEQRAPSASICPSEVARSLEADEPQWRALMPEVRRVARALAAARIIDVTQGDVRLDPDTEAEGPIRLRRGAHFKHP
ncbi:MAG: DUF3253 domain-containing protein [Proteobacteria bacterium]|nr:MAG: DUF3253 domain-containing protein [Pseudomonadota bacterium]